MCLDPPTEPLIPNAYQGHLKYVISANCRYEKMTSFSHSICTVPGENNSNVSAFSVLLTIHKDWDV